MKDYITLKEVPAYWRQLIGNNKICLCPDTQNQVIHIYVIETNQRYNLCLVCGGLKNK